MLDNITMEGHRHIRAVLWSENFKIGHVCKKFEKWVQDIHELSKIAAEDPQAALSA